MIPTNILSSILILGATALAATSSSVSFSTTSPDKALATSITENFKKNSSYFETYHYGNRISYGSSGLELTLAEQYDNPALQSNFYIFFGRIEAQIKAANGTGIVSTVYLQSDDQDEIDWEWLGGDDTQVQSNFFSKGNTTSYDRGKYHDIDNPQDNYYNYTIDWNNERVNWYVEGKLVRTLSNDSSDGFPQTPSKVYIGLWAGGDSSNSEGTIEWAGGLTDYSKAPFILSLKELKVTDYSTGSEYKYTDDSGDWSSIKAVDGKVLGNVNSTGSDSTSSSASSSSTGSSKSGSSKSGTTSNGTSADSSDSASNNSTSSGDSSSSSSSSSSDSSSGNTTSSSSSSSSSSAAASTFGAINSFMALSICVSVAIVLLWEDDHDNEIQQ